MRSSTRAQPTVSESSAARCCNGPRLGWTIPERGTPGMPPIRIPRLGSVAIGLTAQAWSPPCGGCRLLDTGPTASRSDLGMTESPTSSQRATSSRVTRSTIRGTRALERGTSCCMSPGISEAAASRLWCSTSTKSSAKACLEQAIGELIITSFQDTERTQRPELVLFSA